MSKASLIPVASELIKEVNKELYSFNWKGKGKRSNDIEDGGLKILDLDSMISAQRITCKEIRRKLRKLTLKLLKLH